MSVWLSLSGWLATRDCRIDGEDVPWRHVRASKSHQHDVLSRYPVPTVSASGRLVRVNPREQRKQRKQRKKGSQHILAVLSREIDINLMSRLAPQFALRQMVKALPSKV